MTSRAQSGQANLTAIAIVLGIVIASVWIWKRLSPATQEYLIDQAVPLALLGVVSGAAVFMVVRTLRRSRARRQARTRLIAAFQQETAQDKQLNLAFQLIEVNEYRLQGLETVAPALKTLFTTALQRAAGDKQHRTRGMAASYLGVLQDHSIVPLLIAALEDDHAYVRSCAALGLGRLRASDARERLTIAMEEDWDQTVRSRAREALERIRG
ncbi:MAG TPA: HEAT repeat domain-containing protein [Nitrospiraceae bacterium]|jgi:HEAT repeat protein